MIWAELLHLTGNMWTDRTADCYKTQRAKDQAFSPKLVFDRGTWDRAVSRMAEAGMNMVLIDVGDGVVYVAVNEGKFNRLDAAKKAIDSFIARDYIQYRDHWLSYCLEAFTGFSDDPKYYDYALRNVQENLAKIESNTFHAPVCLEMMMAGFKTYLRMKDRGIRTDYLDRSFDPQSFVAALDRRLERMENYWLHPEVAMFMAHPDAVVGTYMVRNSNCRIRIDDEQHSIGGLLLYAELCGPLDALRQTKPESKRFCARR